uniref:Wall-associated receptor kinase galacturonan-binding domain-containing protein n=1 Tax=Setaria italica TaxID=4555 RepID=K3YBP7_SETIT
VSFELQFVRYDRGKSKTKGEMQHTNQSSLWDTIRVKTYSMSLSWGIVPDRRYNPVQWKANCGRSCGNISIPFPFGLEEGCYARKQFQLHCIDMRSSRLELVSMYTEIRQININEGTIETINRDEFSYGGTQSIYAGSISTQELQWVVANLSCQEAQEDSTTYACVSAESTCLGVRLRNDA